MFIVFFPIDKLRANKVIPPHKEKENADLLFYEIVVKCSCCSETICRVPFGANDNSVWFRLFHCDENPGEYQARRVFNYFHKEGKWLFYVHKVLLVKHVKDAQPGKIPQHPPPAVTFMTGSEASDQEFLHNHQIGYIRHIMENIPDEIKTLEYDPSTESDFVNDVVKIKYTESPTISSPMNKMSVHMFRLETWAVNRKFYKRSHVIQLDMSAKFIYHNIIAILSVPLENVNDLIVRFHDVFSRYIRYDVDRQFANTSVITDHNDESIELSYFGDCEDMMHYYLRCFNAMQDIYRYVLEEGTKTFEVVNEFYTNYKPMGFICRIDNKGPQLEFHATILILPLVESYKPYIFEVTHTKVHGQFVDKESELYKRYKVQHALIDRMFYFMFPSFKKKIIHKTVFDPKEFKPL